MNLKTQCSFVCWVPWPCFCPMLESFLSHHESLGTSKVSVIKETLDAYRWQEWESGWTGECMNGVTQFSTGNYFSTLKRVGTSGNSFYFLFCIYIFFFSDHDFLLSASFSLSCSFSRKVSHLVELKTNISVLYNITTLFWLMKSRRLSVFTF